MKTLPEVGLRGTDMERRHMTAGNSSKRHVTVRGAALKHAL